MSSSRQRCDFSTQRDRQNGVSSAGTIKSPGRKKPAKKFFVEWHGGCAVQDDSRIPEKE
jgi:hypothetical protein